MLKAAREICYKGQSQLWSMIPAMELMVRSYEAGHEDMFFFAAAPDFQPLLLVQPGRNFAKIVVARRATF